jgi:ribosomal protein S1
MTYDDDDDYPSSRNNGSNDGLNNMEKRPMEDEKREDYAASNIEGNEITESDKHSFETRPGYRSGQVIGSRVRWVDPGQPKKKTYKKKHITSYNATLT